MIKKDIFDLINSGNAVAIVGSGISIDAGVPSWYNLFKSISDILDKEGINTEEARTIAENGKLPQAFDKLTEKATRNKVQTHCKLLISKHTQPSKHHKRFANWPFKSYVTTNYDHLLEKANNALIPIGNRGKEIFKLSGGVRDIVWHLHGSCELDDDISQMVLSHTDYTEYYPNSNNIRKLGAITSESRCIYLGFGFKDEDFLHVIKAVGRLGNSAKPSYAFLAYPNNSKKDKQRAREHQKKLLDDYNIEVIPYTVNGNDHSQLQVILDCYNPFIVCRELNPNNAKVELGYDPQTTSLTVQSTLDLAELTSDKPSLRNSLVGARILAHLRENPNSTEKDLEPLYATGVPNENEIAQCIAELRDKGIITPAPKLALDSGYRTKVDEAEAQLELAREAFKKSLTTRTKSLYTPPDNHAIGRIVRIVSKFFNELGETEGLSVAQNLATTNNQQAARRAVSTMQMLPKHLAYCKSRDEALAAIQLTTTLLTNPNDAEKLYLGILCQSYFGQHLVNAAINLSEIDINFIEGTCYIIDASVLICFLAEGCEIHDAISNLIADLKKYGAILVTTDLLVREVTGHAYWALYELVEKYGELSPETIAALRCQGEYKQNQFLRGYFLGGQPDSSFKAYINRVLSIPKGSKITENFIIDRLAGLGIKTLSFNEWEGFNDELLAKRVTIQSEIKDRRNERGSFSRDSQTKAEAEVALIVNGIRNKALSIQNHVSKDAFFLSSTRVVDNLPDLKRRISLRPDGLEKWLRSTEGTSPNHAKLVYEHLMYELAQGGIEFVDTPTLLNRFSGRIEAAKNNLDANLNDRREFLIEKFGPNPDIAFSDPDPLDIPRLENLAKNTIINGLENQIAEMQKRAAKSIKNNKLNEEERKELAKLKEKQRQKRLKASHSKKAAKSKKKSKNKSKKKKKK